MTYFENLKKEIPTFEIKINQFISDLGVNIDNLEIDHIGIRTETTEAAQALFDDLISNSNNKILANVVFKNRPIYSIQLETPLIINNQKIYILELAFPDSNDFHSQPVAWEHIEVVIPSNPKTLDEFVDSFENYYPNLDLTTLPDFVKYSFKMPTSNTDKKINPTIKLENSKLNIEIKFHPYSLKSIIGID